MRFMIMIGVCALLACGCARETQEQDLALAAFDTPPEPIEQVTPEYPDGARQAQATGTTHVEVVVNEMGHVMETRIAQSSSHPMLDEAAKTAASQWVFKPAILDEKPVSAKLIIPFEFKLH